MKPDYETFLKETLKDSGLCGPHCDQLALHPVDECVYCAMPVFTPLHKFREDNLINYTGKNVYGYRWPCPSEQRRSIDIINRWPGNRPKPTEGK